MKRIIFILIAALWVGNAFGDIPRAALEHRLDLTREARMVWGINAPVPLFAAQIHQESYWRPSAVSRAGARGMAQFMPATARWMNELFPALGNGDAGNPRWAMRAMVRYDQWLSKRVRGETEYDRMWAMLRSYNGGLGHWRAEARIAGNFERGPVDAACGKAKRHDSHCKENLGYPRRILVVLQPRYSSWGREVK
uniref:Transglycosylase SLT domain-containing protein n=1 Tax=Candidatus Kentrum sp. LFY TaxID=2126342 RepID=A0A450WXL2_9GAMM|nr:MAG: Transglycosylase SLT domain-containing protein [Candidatus Kentron sp. LFY]